ncbi:MAG: hypothetical protein PHI94_04480 [Eubacteriaceae bacterium]|jgi:hypothetical protein|nr:hypothetical protein [Eubacteriaceae bacterium]
MLSRHHGKRDPHEKIYHPLAQNTLPISFSKNDSIRTIVGSGSSSLSNGRGHFDGTFKKGCYRHVKPPKAKGIRVRGEWSEAGGQTLLSLKYSREHLSPLGVLFYFLIFTAVWFFAEHSLDNVPVILFLSGLLTLIITGIWDLAYWFLPAYIKSRNVLKKDMRTCIERLQYAADKENKSPVGH